MRHVRDLHDCAIDVDDVAREGEATNVERLELSCHAPAVEQIRCRRPPPFEVSRLTFDVSQEYWRRIRLPRRQRISHGIEPIWPATSLTVISSPPCRPMITTSSPGAMSSPVTSIVIMSIE